MTRIGKSSCESPTVRSSVAWSKPGANSGMSTGASRMNSAVSSPRTTVIRRIRVEARRNASRRFLSSSCSVKTGTKAACSAASANSERTRFGQLEGDRERRHRPLDAEVARGDDLADEPGDPRGARGDAEEGGGAAQPALALDRLGSERRARELLVDRVDRGSVCGMSPGIRSWTATVCRRQWPTSPHRRSASSAPSGSTTRTATSPARSRRASAGSRAPSPRATPTPWRASTGP